MEMFFQILIGALIFILGLILGMILQKYLSIAHNFNKQVKELNDKLPATNILSSIKYPGQSQQLPGDFDGI